MRNIYPPVDGKKRLCAMASAPGGFTLWKKRKISVEAAGRGEGTGLEHAPPPSFSGDAPGICYFGKH